jgi:hypothetical protein
LPVEWRVTYAVQPPIPFRGADPFNLALDLDFVYGTGGGLTGIVHTAQTIVSDMDAAYRNSSEQLTTFWNSLKSASGIESFSVRTVGAEIVGSSQTRIAVGGSTFTARETNTPDKLNVGGTPVASWLRLANTAFVDRDEAGALRQYYAILEGLHGPSVTTDPGRVAISLARNFVSHGTIDQSSASKAFLARELGYVAPSYQYDPHNPAHRSLVLKYKELAEQAVEAELNRFLTGFYRKW